MIIGRIWSVKEKEKNKLQEAKLDVYSRRVELVVSIKGRKGLT
jgi:hypothetical protein